MKALRARVDLLAGALAVARAQAEELVQLRDRTSAELEQDIASSAPLVEEMDDIVGQLGDVAEPAVEAVTAMEVLPEGTDTLIGAVLALTHNDVTRMADVDVKAALADATQFIDDVCDVDLEASPLHEEVSDAVDAAVMPLNIDSDNAVRARSPIRRAAAPLRPPLGAHVMGAFGRRRAPRGLPWHGARAPTVCALPRRRAGHHDAPELVQVHGADLAEHGGPHREAGASPPRPAYRPDPFPPLRRPARGPPWACPGPARPSPAAGDSGASLPRTRPFP